MGYAKDLYSNKTIFNLMFKKILIYIIRSLIFIVFLTFIFSSVSTNFGNLIVEVFSGIFEYSSPNTQKKVVMNLAQTCSTLEPGSNSVTINQICDDEDLMKSLRENCDEINILMSNNVEIENREEVIETCRQIKSGEIESMCDDIENKKLLSPDFDNLGNLCNEYNSGTVSDKEFFSNFISGSFGNQETDIPQMAIFENYNKFIMFLDDNKIIYFFILIILIGLMYSLFMNLKLFLLTMGGICFSIGFFILLPYFGILAYDKFVGIDTSSILGSIFSIEPRFDIQGIISILLIMFLKIYNTFIIMLGFVFLSLGISGKIVGYITKKKTIKNKLK